MMRRTSARVARTMVAALLAVGLVAAAGSGADRLVLGEFEDGRVVVSPGLVLAKGEDFQDFGFPACTTGFIAVDRAYRASRTAGRRYLLTVANWCGNVQAYGDERSWPRGEGPPVHLAEANPSLVVPAAGVDQRGPVVGRIVWTDQRAVPTDPGLGFNIMDVAVVLLDDDVSVDPEIPGVGIPTEVIDSFRSVVGHGPDADVLTVVGRGMGVDVVASERSGPVVGIEGTSHLCIGIPLSDGDQGAPLVDAQGRAAGIVMAVDGASSASVDGEVCATPGRAMQLRDIFERFRASTGIELSLLTHPAGPIIRGR